MESFAVFESTFPEGWAFFAFFLPYRTFGVFFTLFVLRSFFIESIFFTVRKNMFIYLRYIDGSEMNFEFSFLNKVRQEVKV